MRYIFLAPGIWLLYKALRGVEHSYWNFGKKDWKTRPMSRTTRIIFFAGGAVISAFTILMLWFDELC
jgi:hypothetical protein